MSRYWGSSEKQRHATSDVYLEQRAVIIFINYKFCIRLEMTPTETKENWTNIRKRECVSITGVQVAHEIP